MFIIKKSLTILLGKCYGGNTCCTDDEPCGEGEGDCDHDSNCKNDLICLRPNGKGCHKHIASSNWDSSDDCCVDPKKYGAAVEVSHSLHKVSAQWFIFSF